jgi:hypothetical protein
MLTPQTLFSYLIGQRDAVFAIATDPHALWIGFLFALSAGLARHFNRTDLLRHPGRLLVPAAASALLSFGLVGLAFLKTQSAISNFLPACRAMLALFWMTAPLAWLYAIPWRRFLDDRRAQSAKLWTLALISAWRLSLAIRVLALFMNDTPAPAGAVVMLFVDTVVLVALYVTRTKPAPSTPRIVEIMGGISSGDPVVRYEIHRLTILITVVAVLSYPLWLATTFQTETNGLDTTYFLIIRTGAATPQALYLLAIAACIFFALLLPITQPALRRRSRVNLLFKQNDLAAAIRYLSDRQPADFPWDYQPPPIQNFREPPTLLAIIETLANQPAAPWVRDLYLDRFRQYLRNPIWYFPYEDELRRVVSVLERLPEGAEFARIARAAINDRRMNRRASSTRFSSHRNSAFVRGFLTPVIFPDPPPPLKGRLRRSIRALRELSQQAKP